MCSLQPLRHISTLPLTSFTALQKCGRYRRNSGQTAPSGMTVSAALIHRGHSVVEGAAYSLGANIDKL